MPTARTRYGRVAAFYDFSGSLYSLGRIAACKRRQIDLLSEGERVLYAGCGGGEDVAMAAEKGLRVDVVELSAGMLEQTRSRLLSRGLLERVHLMEGDVAQYQASQPYDAVVANFFLNVFSEAEMPPVFHHLASMVRPGGALLVADFAPPSGAVLAQVAQKAYWYYANLLFWAVAGNPVHPLYDYRSLVEKAGLQLVDWHPLPLWSGGPGWFVTLVARRPSCTEAN
jgi:demethylphylloquinol methyltransferase